jgi:hypothetical protein
MIIVHTPDPATLLSTGESLGSCLDFWFFEGDIPVVLKDATGLTVFSLDLKIISSELPNHPNIRSFLQQNTVFTALLCLKWSNNQGNIDIREIVEVIDGLVTM